MNSIVFKRENGGLGRRIDGQDHISGLILSFSGVTSVSTYLFRTVEEAEAAGITAASHEMAHYHISEFFRVATGAKLYVLLAPSFDGSFGEIKALQQYAEGSLRQVGILLNDDTLANTMAKVGSIQMVCDELAAQNMPLSAIISPSMLTTDLTNINDLPDVHEQNAPRVSVCIAQDGGGYGAAIATRQMTSVGALGTVLGTVARSRVSDSIGWIEKYNVVSSVYPKTLTDNVTKAREMDVPALADGTLVNTLTPEKIQALNDKGYIFLIKHVGYAGSYWNDGFSADKLTSDYAYIESNRTVDKACRGVYQALLPKISGPAYVDPDTGFLTADTVAALEALAEDPLAQMERNGELSGYLVSIDPEQDLLGTSKLNVTIRLVPVGVLREIIVSIGLALSIES